MWKICNGPCGEKKPLKDYYNGANNCKRCHDEQMKIVKQWRKNGGDQPNCHDVLAEVKTVSKRRIGVKYFHCKNKGCAFKIAEQTSDRNKNLHIKFCKFGPNKEKHLELKCDMPRCLFYGKSPRGLAQHKRVSHKIVRTCHFKGCKYSNGDKTSFRKHLLDVHNVDANVWIKCDVPGCNFKTKVQYTLKMHKSCIHNMDVEWKVCPYEGCKFKSKTRRTLRNHLAQNHDIFVGWHFCDIGDCQYSSESSGDLKRHKANIHDIDVRWLHCGVDGCEHKSKVSWSMKIHKAAIHGIDVVYHYCDLCDFKCRQSGNLNAHKIRIHGAEKKKHRHVKKPKNQIVNIIPNRNQAKKRGAGTLKLYIRRSGGSKRLCTKI